MRAATGGTAGRTGGSSADFTATVRGSMGTASQLRASQQTQETFDEEDDEEESEYETEEGSSIASSSLMPTPSPATGKRAGGKNVGFKSKSPSVLGTPGGASLASAEVWGVNSMWVSPEEVKRERRPRAP